MQAAEAAGKAESMALNAAQLARTAHTKAALAAAISASQAYNQVTTTYIARMDSRWPQSRQECYNWRARLDIHNTSV